LQSLLVAVVVVEKDIALHHLKHVAVAVAERYLLDTHLLLQLALLAQAEQVV
jgi:3-polyprenyl-4-hydroxybenzoate decarboxylase